MDFDAFSGGIEPGGLRNKNDIGILICYMLNHIKKPFSKEDLIELIQENGLANYFETITALEDLIKCNNIQYDDDAQTMLVITKNGQLISNQLHTTLSLSVRQKAVSVIAKFMEKRKIEHDNPVSIKKTKDGGYNVTFKITDGMRDLMSLTLFVPTLSEANSLKRSFHRNPEKVYSIILAGVIGEKSMIDNALRGLKS